MGDNHTNLPTYVLGALLVIVVIALGVVLRHQWWGVTNQEAYLRAEARWHQNAANYLNDDPKATASVSK